MDRTQKEEMVTFLKGVFGTSASVVVVRNRGLNVAEMSDLRGKMREQGATLKVAKNRLARLALEGTKIEGLGDHLNGATVLGYSEDVVAAAKVLVNYAKDNEKIEIVGGTMESTILDESGVKTLAGGVVGGAFFKGIEDILTRFTYWRLALGLIIIFVVIVAPNGIVGSLRHGLERLSLLKTSKVDE